jgi:hypothetical protein
VPAREPCPRSVDLERGKRVGVTEVGWDKGGRYYTRSRKVGGKVVREYVGCGPDAALIARMDAVERQRRDTAREDLRTQKAQLDELAARLDELIDTSELAACAALAAAGYRRHNRGEWRKSRGGHESDGCGGAAEG